MWLNMNCLSAICVDRNQQAFLAQMTPLILLCDMTLYIIPSLLPVVLNI